MRRQQLTWEDDMKRILLVCLLCALVQASAFGAPPTFGASKKKTEAASGAVVEPPIPTWIFGTRVDVLFTSSDAAFDTDSYVGIDQLTISEAGIYLVTFKGVNQLDSSFLALYYSVNDGTFIECCFSLGADGAWPHTNGSELLQLNAGDTIRFGVYSSSNNVSSLRFGIVKQ
jgi:hypothetical protein